MATPPYLRQGEDRNWGMRRELPGDLRDAFRIDKKGTKGKAGRNDEEGLARVPEHLRVVICRREVVKTYGKITYEAAKRRHYREIAEVDGLIAEARAWLASQGMEARAEPASHLVTPTLADAKAAILSWFHRQERRRLARPVPDDPDDREAVLDALRGENAALAGEDGRQRAERVLFGDDPARTGDAVPSTSITRQRADRHGAGILASAGFAAPSGEVRRLAVEIMQQVMAEGVRRDLERYGELAGAANSSLSGITVLSAPPPAPVAGITFGQLVDRYLAAPERAGLSPKTKLKYAGFRRVLVEIIGETTAASAVDRAACRDAQAVLLALPANAAKRWPKLTARQAAQKAKAEGAEGMHPKSAGNHLDFLAAVYGFGAREGLVEKNPASGLNASTAKGTTALANGEKRRPFTLDELRKVFAAPLYTGCVDDGNGYDKPGPNQFRRGRYWVPLVGLWTGMRLNEVCQLGVADVETVDGVPIIHVRASAEGARLKTVAAERRVPVHPELVRLGFLAHVEKQRKAGEDRLFPDLPMGKMGTYADPFSKWFGRFLTKAKVTAPNVVFHSLRHGFRDRMREAGIPKEVADALGGWAATGEGSNYGSGYSVATLAEHVGKITYPGLDLSHLYVAEAVQPGCTGLLKPPVPLRD